MEEVIKFGPVALSLELLNRDVLVKKIDLLNDTMRGGRPRSRS